MANSYKLAKLNDCKGNLTKQWFVYVSYEVPGEDYFVRKKYNISNKLKTKTDRHSRAREMINELNEKLRNGWIPLDDEKSNLVDYHEALKNALVIKAATTSKRTNWTYTSVVKGFIEYLDKYEKIKYINQINNKIAQNYFDFILLNRKLSVKTYNNKLTALRTMFYLLLKRNYIIRNPFITIDKLTVPDPPITAFTVEEEQLLRDSLYYYDRRLYIISLFIYYCFLRPADIVRLKFENIFLEDQVIIIYGIYTKGKRQHVVTIPDPMLKDLNEAGFSDNYKKDLLVFSRGLEPGNFEIAPTRIAERWNKYKKFSGIKKNIYQLKHTGNGRALQAGINILDIKRQDRHASLAYTEIYLNKFSKNPSKNLQINFPKLGVK